MDKIYLSCDKNKIIFLDCTRLDGEDSLVSRRNTDDLTSVDKEIEIISSILKDYQQNKIILADDVVFSGSVLRKIITKFKDNQIEVVGIRSCISTEDSYQYFNNQLPLGLKCGYLMEKDVIDQICERDFYFGIVQSGISVKKEGKIYKAPYFKPFGNPIERASIPPEYEKLFSDGCIRRSIDLWSEIESLSRKKIYVKDLPERINLADSNEEVVKVLVKRRVQK